MKVSNPLTIIAIFSGLAETLATAALVKLPPETQSIFVYFVMIFPSGIVLLFFWVLYFKNTVLYAPSDFSDQSHYLEANHLKKSLSETVDIVIKDVNEHGAQLSTDQIEHVKNSLKSSIDIATATPNERNIIEFLRENPSTTTDIKDGLGLNFFSWYPALHSLAAKGIVTKNTNTKTDITTWKLTT